MIELTVRLLIKMQYCSYRVENILQNFQPVYEKQNVFYLYNKEKRVLLSVLYIFIENFL